MDGCWGTSHPNRATSGPKGPEITDNKVADKKGWRGKKFWIFYPSGLNCDYISKLYWELKTACLTDIDQLLAKYWVDNRD